MIEKYKTWKCQKHKGGMQGHSDKAQAEQVAGILLRLLENIWGILLDHCEVGYEGVWKEAKVGVVIQGVNAIWVWMMTVDGHKTVCEVWQEQWHY